MTTELQDAPPESGRRPEYASIDFMAMVSHDLRTPLAAIKEALSLLSETAEGQLDERQRRYLAVAREEIDRLNRMIGNIVEAARIDAGKVVLHRDAVDLSELLTTTIDSLSLLIQKRNLVVERNVSSALPKVLGDRDRLLRVFGNLLDNAIKYSPPGGTIRVDIGPADPDSHVLIETEVAAGDGYVEVAVSDEGPGIPAAFNDRVFGKFESVDPHGPGTGLGLAIVRTIVEMHHGRVWVESSPGKGARFRFLLPIKENP
jgi:signal transduction histidine kinase